MELLRTVTFMTMTSDAKSQKSGQKDMEPNPKNQAKTVCRTREISDYNKWLAREVQKSLNDPRPHIPHDEVMAMLDAKIAKLKEKDLK